MKKCSPVAQSVEQVAVPGAKLAVKKGVKEHLGTKVEKRSYASRRGYLIKAVYARRKKVRKMAVAYKGGECEICGYDKCIDALEFHHNNSSGKDFGISDKGYTRSWKRVQEELDKCILICANCHRELHSKIAAPGGNTGMKKRANSGKPKAGRPG